MIQKCWLFRSICSLCAFSLILLVSSPLVTLAFFTYDNHKSLTALIPQKQKPELADSNILAMTSDTQDAIPDAYYLGETIADLPPNDKIVYDVFTVSERKSRNLPTALLDREPYYGDKVVYLTFDDGPDPDNTPKVLKILRENNIKATFFVVGTQIEKHPEILKHIYTEGHAIGNHTYNHIYRELYKSVDTYFGQLHHNDDIIKNLLGARPRISRAPGGSSGSFTKAYWETLRSEGYVEIGWNVSSGDASSANAKQIVNNISYQMQNKFLWSHAIVLLHDGKGHSETVKALPAIIKFFKDSGFEFRAVNLHTPPAW